MISRFMLVLTLAYKLIRVTKESMVNVNDGCLVFYIFRLRTMAESTWKILKLDWKTPGFSSSKRVGTLNEDLSAV